MQKFHVYYYSVYGSTTQVEVQLTVNTTQYSEYFDTS